MKNISKKKISEITKNEIEQLKSRYAHSLGSLMTRQEIEYN